MRLTSTSRVGPMSLEVTADPTEPDEGPHAGRRFFVDVDELARSPAGALTGVRRVRFEPHTTRAGPAG